jgi:hypothetical protein
VQVKRVIQGVKMQASVSSDPSMFDALFQPGAASTHKNDQKHQNSQVSDVSERKNQYVFRGAAGSEGFTRFVPPAKSTESQPSGNEPTQASASHAQGDGGGVGGGGQVDPEIVRRAEAQSKAMIKSAAGGLLGNLAIINVAKMALVGMAAGAIYGLAKNTAETQGVLYELKYKTTAFDMDPFASQLFHKLGRYEHLQPQSYKLAIHYCDKLFLLERHLASPTTRPTDTDIPMAQSCVDGVLSHVMLMRNHSENGEQRGQLNILKVSIAEMLSDHRKRIYARCATLRL